jgi:hypothetical protein
VYEGVPLAARFTATSGCLDQGEAHRCCTPGDRPQSRHGL